MNKLKKNENISLPPIFRHPQVLKRYRLFSHLMLSVNRRSELVTVHS